MSRFHCWLGFSILLLCLLSCRRIPLYEAESGVYLKLDLAFEETVRSHVGFRTPASVRVCFYDMDLHSLVAEEFLPTQGGFIYVAPGQYDMIVYSLGTEVTQVDGTDVRALARAFTGNAGQVLKVSKADGSTVPRNYNVIYEPDHLFVGRLPGVRIPVHSGEDPTVVIECPMETLLETYSLELSRIENADCIREALVYITGQAPCKYLWDGRFPPTPSALFFPLQTNADDQSIHTVFNTFGRIPGVGSEVYLNVQVTAATGARYQWIFDVSDQFDNPDNTDSRIVITEPVIVPDDGSTGGMTPSVNDWDAEIINVPL